MKILRLLYFASGGLHSGLAGGARLYNMANALKSLNCRIDAFSIVLEKRISITQEILGENVKANHVHLPVRFPKLLLPLVILFFIIVGIGKSSKANAIFAQSPTLTALLPAFVLSKLFRRPLVIDHIDTKPAFVPWALYRIPFRSATNVLVLSRYLENEALRMGSRRTTFLPIFVDTDKFRPDNYLREKTRDHYNFKDKTVIGFAGSFWRGEGVLYLLQAFKDLMKIHGNIHLFLVGARNVPDSDDVYGQIKDLGLKEKCTVLPRQTYNLMPSIFSAMDIACAPKTVCQENIAANPIKIYEYMSMALPVVTSAIGEIVTVIENGENGLLVEPEDTISLYDAIDFLLQNPKISNQIGKQARSLVLDEFSRDAFSKVLNDILKSLLRNG